MKKYTKYKSRKNKLKNSKVMQTYHYKYLGKIYNLHLKYKLKICIQFRRRKFRAFNFG